MEKSALLLPVLAQMKRTAPNFTPKVPADIYFSPYLQAGVSRRGLTWLWGLSDASGTFKFGLCRISTTRCSDWIGISFSDWIHKIIFFILHVLKLSQNMSLAWKPEYSPAFLFPPDPRNKITGVTDNLKGLSVPRRSPGKLAAVRHWHSHVDAVSENILNTCVLLVTNIPRAHICY